MACMGVLEHRLITNHGSASNHKQIQKLRCQRQSPFEHLWVLEGFRNVATLALEHTAELQTHQIGLEPAWHNQLCWDCSCFNALKNGDLPPQNIPAEKWGAAWLSENDRMMEPKGGDVASLVMTTVPNMLPTGRHRSYLQQEEKQVF